MSPYFIGKIKVDFHLFKRRGIFEQQKKDIEGILELINITFSDSEDKKTGVLSKEAISKLKDLKELKDSKAITAVEFNKMKKELLNELK